MTEKRFECMGNGYFVDNLEDADLDNKEVVDILNHLHEENEQLKKENKKLKEDLEHCANQFTNDGKNVLLSLR